MCGSSPLTPGKALKLGARALYNPLGATKDTLLSANRLGTSVARDAGVLPQSAATQQAEATASAAASRAAADAEASSIANARIRAQRKAMRENSLLTGAGGGGRATLGV